MAYTLRTKDNALDAGRAADQNESVDNDIFFNTVIGGGTDWATYDSNPQGWVNDPLTTELFRWKRIGNLVIVQIHFIDTSNATTKTCTLPVAAAAGGVGFKTPCLTQDNGGAFVWGAAAVAPGSSTLDFRPAPAAGSVWTAGGGCQIYRAVFMYEV